MSLDTVYPVSINIIVSVLSTMVQKRGATTINIPLCWELSNLSGVEA